ncbi:MAG: FaeA/PapI family transcriptional regulator [Candidatus Hodarchaeales archaeon]
MISKNLTRLEQLILEAIKEISKPVKQKELANYLGISVRLSRYGLTNLVKADIISSKPDLADLRSLYYLLNEKNNFKNILRS